MEAKIETARHNLKIQMDKELVVLQKQINLHVADIERYQGFVSRLAITKGNTVEELRRGKEQARKTMKQLKASKATTSKTQGAPSGGMSTLAAAGRESVAAASAYRSQAISQPPGDAFIEGSPVDIVLFGFRRVSSNFMTSFNASQGSGSDGPSGNQHVVQALRHLIKNQPLLQYNISTLGADGRRLYSEENTAAAGGIGKLSQEAQLQTKI